VSLVWIFLFISISPHVIVIIVELLELPDNFARPNLDVLAPISTIIASLLLLSLSFSFALAFIFLLLSLFGLSFFVVSLLQ
jgi:hypothetical protein